MSDHADPPGQDSAHVGYWNEWNKRFRFRDDHDEFMAGQLRIAHEFAQRRHRDRATILDVGCGTGWLGNSLREFGDVVGTDLAPDAIADGRRRFPEIDLIEGDFMHLDLGGPFDLVVSSDALVPMPDHRACIDRIASLQRAGGALLLMTQNPWVWARRSTMRAHDPSVPNGDVDQWPTRRGVRSMLGPHYEIDRISTFLPGGDRGVLFWVEQRYIRGGMSRLVGRQRWRRALESARLGRELVIEATRR